MSRRGRRINMETALLVLVCIVKATSGVIRLLSYVELKKSLMQKKW